MFLSASWDLLFLSDLSTLRINYLTLARRSFPLWSLKNINVQERKVLFARTNVILSGASRTITGKGMGEGRQAAGEGSRSLLIRAWQPRSIVNWKQGWGAITSESDTGNLKIAFSGGHADFGPQAAWTENIYTRLVFLMSDLQGEANCNQDVEHKCLRVSKRKETFK